MAILYDAYGRPIDQGRLKDEIAGPSVTGVRTPISGHPAQGLTPERLASLLRAAEQGDETGYLELAEEMEEKDLHYRAVLATRKLQVSGLEITVEAASDSAADTRAADLVREVAGTARGAIFDILDAVGKGFSVCEIFWDVQGRQWTPERVEWRDPRWFGFDPQTGRGPYLRGDAGLLEPLAPAKFIGHTHKTKSGLPIRGGLARAAAWAYLFKNFDLKSWVLFAEVYGHPLRVGRYGPDATDGDRQTLLRAVRNISADHAAIIPESMALEFIDAKAQGNAQIFERLAEYLDRQVSKLVLGQTGTTDTGSRVGTADAHERVRADIESDDAEQLSAVLNRDLVRPLVTLNFGPMQAYPALKVFRAEQEDMDSMVGRLEKLVPMGLRVGASTVRDKLGFPDPDPGEECLGRPAPQDDARTTVRPGMHARTAHSTAHSTAHVPADGSSEPDWLDAMADEALEDWQPLMDPLARPIVDLAERCQSFAEFEAGLAGIISAQDATPLARALARSMFVARLTAASGAHDA